MKNYFILTLSYILLVLLSACSHSTEKSQQEGQGIESKPLALKLSKVLEGQWKAEEAEGIPPHWREFDPTNNTFRTWSHNGPRLSKPDGSYEVIGDTVLQITSGDDEAPRKYGLDSLSDDYLEMWYYGVSASNLIYQRADYEENHLKDIRNDTIAVDGKVIEATDVGWAYTYGLLIDVGTDTLSINYFTEKYSENSLRNKHVSLRYINTIEYNYPGSNSQSQVFEITGIYKILDYGGDLPGQYSITDKNGKSIVFDAFLYEEDSKMEGTEVSEIYTERYKINIVSLEVKRPIMNTLVFGDWNIVSSDTVPIGYGQIKIRPGGEEGVYIDFGGQGENYVKTDIYSNTIAGTNASGKFKIELIPGDPILLDYTDDGNGGHYEPIKNQKYQKQVSDNRKLLIGKWRGIEDPTLELEFTDKEVMMGWIGSNDPYVLSNIYMSEQLKEYYSHTTTGEVVYISTLENGESYRGYEILKLDKDHLSYTAYSTPNNFRRVK